MNRRELLLLMGGAMTTARAGYYPIKLGSCLTTDDVGESARRPAPRLARP
jgi:hypothetical protein